MFCTDFVGWGESPIKLLPKIHQVQHMSVLFVSLQSPRYHLQNNTFILRKIVENLSDMVWPIKNTANLSFQQARSETRAARATRAKIFIAKTMSDSIILTFLGHRRHKNPLLFKTGHFLKFTRVARVFVLDL